MAFENSSAPVRPTAGCLAAGQRVCTSKGAVAVEDLAKGAGFEAICFDPKRRRYVARPARAAATGRKMVIRVHTDKGSFAMTPDQTVFLEHGAPLSAEELTPGTRLCACTVKPQLDDRVSSADFGKERLDMDHLTQADCAVANWYPVPSVEVLGEAEVYAVEVEGTGAPTGAAPAIIWAVGTGGGIGIAIGARVES
jgi:hypothetical protein